MNIVLEKSFEFAVRSVNLNKFLVENKKEFVLSRQVLKSGTAIGAMVREAQYAESNADFVHKLSTALKEAGETGCWLELLNRTHYINTDCFGCLFSDNEQLLKLLTSRIKKSRQV